MHTDIGLVTFAGTFTPLARETCVSNSELKGILCLFTVCVEMTDLVAPSRLRIPAECRLSGSGILVKTW
jgi:hypothetical protein